MAFPFKGVVKSSSVICAHYNTFFLLEKFDFFDFYRFFKKIERKAVIGCLRDSLKYLIIGGVSKILIVRIKW